MKEYDILIFIAGALFSVVFWGLLNSFTGKMDLFADPLFCLFVAVFLIFLFDRFEMFKPGGIS